MSAENWLASYESTTHSFQAFGATHDEALFALIKILRGHAAYFGIGVAALETMIESIRVDEVTE